MAMLGSQILLLPYPLEVVCGLINLTLEVISLWI